MGASPLTAARCVLGLPGRLERLAHRGHAAVQAQIAANVARGEREALPRELARVVLHLLDLAKVSDQNGSESPRRSGTLHPGKRKDTEQGIRALPFSIWAAMS